MLSIKLPKGKVARALLDCADSYAVGVDAERIAWEKDTEVWRASRAARVGAGGPVDHYPPSAPNSANKDKALKFAEMSVACTHSIGDVYVDEELWKEIKGYYY